MICFSLSIFNLYVSLYSQGAPGSSWFSGLARRSNGLTGSVHGARHIVRIFVFGRLMCDVVSLKLGSVITILAF